MSMTNGSSETPPGDTTEVVEAGAREWRSELNAELRYFATEDDERVTAKQYQAIGYLLSGYSVREAAKKVDKHYTSLYRWLKQPAFRHLYRESLATLHRESLHQRITIRGLAYEVLIEELRDTRDVKLALEIVKAFDKTQIDELEIVGLIRSTSRGRVGDSWFRVASLTDYEDHAEKGLAERSRKRYEAWQRQQRMQATLRNPDDEATE